MRSPEISDRDEPRLILGFVDIVVTLRISRFWETYCSWTLFIFCLNSMTEQINEAFLIFLSAWSIKHTRFVKWLKRLYLCMSRDLVWISKTAKDYSPFVSSGYSVIRLLIIASQRSSLLPSATLLQK